MGRDLGGVLVLDDAQLERVGLVRADDVGGGSVLVHWLVMRGVWSGFWMAVASGSRINRQPARDIGPTDPTRTRTTATALVHSPA